MKSLATLMPFVLLPCLGAQDPDSEPGTDLDQAFAEAQPPPCEALWTAIPWRRSLTDALAEAAETGKPVYLYVNDGDVASGRC